MSKQVPKAALHLAYLDGLRAISALYVVASHAISYVVPAQENAPFGLRLIFDVISHGTYSVDVFIVLSGFCLMLPIAMGRTKQPRWWSDFFRRRAWRIVPTYYCAMLLALLVIQLAAHERTGTIWDTALPVTARSIVSHLLLVQDAFGESHSICYPMWSIAVEWRIYFLFPLLVWSWERFGGPTTAAVTTIVSFALYCLCVLLFRNSLTAHYIGLFSMGMLGASIGYTPEYAAWRRWPWLGMAMGFAFVVIILAPLKIYGGRVIPPFVMDYVVGVAATSLLVAASNREHSLVQRIFSGKLLVATGVFAYSLYLVHAPLLQVFWQLLQPWKLAPWPEFFVLFFVGIPVVVALSRLFFLCCERPFLRRKIGPQRSEVIRTVLEPAP